MDRYPTVRPALGLISLSLLRCARWGTTHQGLSGGGGDSHSDSIRSHVRLISPVWAVDLKRIEPCASPRIQNPKSRARRMRPGALNSLPDPLRHCHKVFMRVCLWLLWVSVAFVLKWMPAFFYVLSEAWAFVIIYKVLRRQFVRQNEISLAIPWPSTIKPDTFFVLQFSWVSGSK